MWLRLYPKTESYTFVIQVNIHLEQILQETMGLFLSIWSVHWQTKVGFELSLNTPPGSGLTRKWKGEIPSCDVAVIDTTRRMLNTKNTQ